MCVDTPRQSAGRPSEEGLRFIRAATRSSTSGTSTSAAGGVGRRRGASRFSRAATDADVDQAGARTRRRSRSSPWAASRSRHDGRGARAGMIDIVAAAGRRSPTRSCRRRSRRAATTTSASASAATSAPRASSAARHHLHPERDRRRGVPARAGTRSGSSHAENADRDVLVVGAGPAGMECAMVLGKRGMRRVHLVDAQDEIGGCMRMISAYPTSASGAADPHYRKIQLDKLRNVEVRPRHPARPRTCSPTAPRSSSSRPAPAGATTA